MSECLSSYSVTCARSHVLLNCFLHCLTKRNDLSDRIADVWELEVKDWRPDRDRVLTAPAWQDVKRDPR